MGLEGKDEKGDEGSKVKMRRGRSYRPTRGRVGALLGEGRAWSSKAGSGGGRGRRRARAGGKGGKRARRGERGKEGRRKAEVWRGKGV